MQKIISDSRTLSSKVALKLPSVPSLIAFLTVPLIPLTVRRAAPSNFATSKEELNILFENKENIGGFVHDLYWSSTKDLSVTEYTAVWMQYFRDGPNSGVQLRWSGDYGTNHVRAIRAF